MVRTGAACVLMRVGGQLRHGKLPILNQLARKTERRHRPLQE
jgi:hypothetical protein